MHISLNGKPGPFNKKVTEIVSSTYSELHIINQYPDSFVVSCV
jgi:hypothetical protein